MDLKTANNEGAAVYTGRSHYKATFCPFAPQVACEYTIFICDPNHSNTCQLPLPPMQNNLMLSKHIPFVLQQQLVLLIRMQSGCKRFKDPVKSWYL